MDIRNIIFDLDGTLIDSAPGILAAITEVLRVFNVESKVAIDNSLIAEPLRQTLIKIANDIDDDMLDQMVVLFKDIYDNQKLLATLVFDNVDAVLDKLKKSEFRLFVATNKRQLPCSRIIDHLGLDSYFEAVYSLDGFIPEKENKAALISQLMTDYNLNVGQTIYVGDRFQDYRAASETGLSYLHADWGYEDASFSGNQSTICYLNHPADILKYLGIQ